MCHLWNLTPCLLIVLSSSPCIVGFPCTTSTSNDLEHSQALLSFPMWLLMAWVGKCHAHPSTFSCFYRGLKSANHTLSLLGLPVPHRRGLKVRRRRGPINISGAFASGRWLWLQLCGGSFSGTSRHGGSWSPPAAAVTAPPAAKPSLQAPMVGRRQHLFDL